MADSFSIGDALSMQLQQQPISMDVDNVRVYGQLSIVVVSSSLVDFSVNDVLVYGQMSIAYLNVLDELPLIPE